MIADLCDFAVLHAEGIVILTAGMAGSFCTIANLYSFHGTDRHDSFREVGIQLLEHRISDACGKSFDKTFHATAHGIAGFSCLLQISAGFFISFCIRHGSDRGAGSSTVELCQIRIYGTDGTGIGEYGNAHLFQNLCSNGSGSHASDGLTTEERPPPR